MYTPEFRSSMALEWKAEHMDAGTWKAFKKSRRGRMKGTEDITMLWNGEAW
jgi:hypothetical protein